MSPVITYSWCYFFRCFLFGTSTLYHSPNVQRPHVDGGGSRHGRGNKLVNFHVSREKRISCFLAGDGKGGREGGKDLGKAKGQARGERREAPIIKRWRCLTRVKPLNLPDKGMHTLSGTACFVFEIAIMLLKRQPLMSLMIRHSYCYKCTDEVGCCLRLRRTFGEGKTGNEGVDSPQAASRWTKISAPKM